MTFNQMPPGMQLPPGMTHQKMQQMMQQMQGGMQGMQGMPGMNAGGQPMHFSGHSFHRPSEVDHASLENQYGVDPKRWRCLYPCYFNIDKKYEQGRRIAKKYCVQSPHPMDIADVCKYLGLPFFIEYSKKHPRDFFNPGRVRVLLKDGEGNHRRDDIRNVRQLMIAIGKMIPKLESRKKRLITQKMLIKRRNDQIQKMKEEKEIAAQKKNFKTAKQIKYLQKKKKRGKGGNKKSKRGGRRGRK